MFVPGLILLICFATYPADGQSRNVARSGEYGDVNLVEFSIRGVTYGRCTFTDDGEDLELLYEDRAGEIAAKAMNPTVADPISKTQICRDLAGKPVPPSSQFRTSIGDVMDVEPSQSLQHRLDKFQQSLQSNDVYLNYLRPRFIGDMMNNIGILVGGNNNFGGFGLHIPDRTNNNNKNEVNIGLNKPWWGR